MVAILVHWQSEGNKAGWDLACQPTWSWRVQGSSVAESSCFQSRRLSRNDIFYGIQPFILGSGMVLLRSMASLPLIVSQLWSWQGLSRRLSYIKWTLECLSHFGRIDVGALVVGLRSMILFICIPFFIKYICYPLSQMLASSPLIHQYGFPISWKFLHGWDISRDSIQG